MLQLPAGTFTIPCNGVANKFVKNRVTIRGMGYQRTTILRDPNPAYAENNQAVLWGIGDDITVEDLTLDSGGTDDSQFAYQALRIDGRRSNVRRVRSINSCGCWGRVEDFVFFICPPRNDPAGGCLISECRIEQVKGGWVSGFCVWGATQVRDCRVEFPSLAGNTHPPMLVGYQAAYSNGASFIGCTQTGGNGFFYTDTGSDTNLRISNCNAINVQQGIIMTRTPDDSIDGFLIDGNIIELSTGAYWGDGCNAIAISGDGVARNVRITNNLIRYVGGAPGNPANVGKLLAAAVVTVTRAGSVVVGNSWDSGMDHNFEEGATVQSNKAIAGATPPDPTNPT